MVILIAVSVSCHSNAPFKGSCPSLPLIIYYPSYVKVLMSVQVLLIMSVLDIIYLTPTSVDFNTPNPEFHVQLKYLVSWVTIPIIMVNLGMTRERHQCSLTQSALPMLDYN